uniref:PCI domain-containing protein n=1 Tax=Chrysocystis fragilis TaxID=1411660 RepID=A0A7S0TD30_9STRA|mmetsp:Transcript_367/g.1119  ORF Transcript_367/g.1119 Transcript_367/m.1119 type:complete len:259 (+) Transcript_367:20-796(+)
MSRLEEAGRLRDEMRQSLGAGDYAGASTRLAAAKLALLELGKSAEEGMMVVGQEVMELAVLLAVHTQDSSSFQRYVSQLKPYYASPRLAAQSALRPTILGLHLLFLIVENRLADFHSELELLSESDRARREVAFTIALEQNLMVGTYNEVLHAKSSMPSPEHFAFFMGRLLDTVRDTIAECSEVSYDSLSLEAAREMMMFDTTDDLLTFIHASRASKWRVADGRIYFDAAQQLRGREIPSVRLLTENLAYATELERIV